MQSAPSYAILILITLNRLPDDLKNRSYIVPLPTSFRFRTSVAII